MVYLKEIKLSPNSLDLFLECQACFWLDKKQGIKRPPVYPYSLNLELDALLKEEFDTYRKQGQQPPILENSKLKANLFSNQKLLNQWRNKSVGLRYFDEKLQATLFGVVDDILELDDGRLAPLDYKSTGIKVTKIYDRFQLQLDIYSSLLEKNGFKTNKKAYLAFYIIDKRKGFLDKIPFRKEILEIKTNSSEVYDIFKDAVEILKNDVIPKHSVDCQFYKWQKATNTLHR
jgi:hypothetical protein